MSQLMVYARLCKDRWCSTEHSLLHCPWVKSVWKNSRFGTMVHKAQGLNLLDIGMMILKDLQREEYELWAVMVWQVWCYICKILHSEPGSHEKKTENDCVALWEAYQAARPTFTMDNILGVELGEKKWYRPRRGRFRVDVDVLFHPEVHAFGVGVIVRDWCGRTVVALSKRTGPSSNAMVAEVLAVIQGIVVSVEHDVAPIEIYTDSIIAARIMASPDDEAQLLPDKDRKVLALARDNILIGIFHMFRTANRAAHRFAQEARFVLQSKCWIADFPSWLRDIVCEDNS